MILNEIKKDFRSLSDFLSKWDANVKNAGLLNNIDIEGGKKTDTSLKYSIDRSNPLVFLNIDMDRHCLPFGIEKLNKNDITFEVKLMASCKEINATSDDMDPIEALGIDIIIECEYDNGTGIKGANCSWHLDKDSSASALFTHPIYHMNFGGKHMVKKGAIFGELLLLSSPRIIHPPMDIILSCDFIIRNFYTKERHKKITQNPGYITLVERAQTRYWKSFGSAFNSKWIKNGSIKNLPYSSLIGH